MTIRIENRYLYNVVVSRRLAKIGSLGCGAWDLFPDGICGRDSLDDVFSVKKWKSKIIVTIIDIGDDVINL